MNGIHDLGGMHGFGRVQPEANEPVFHHAWEKTVFGMALAAMAQGLVNVDEFRYGIEQMDPVDYLASSYYEHWLATLEKNLVRKGIVDPAQLRARLQEIEHDPSRPPLRKKNPSLAEQLMKVVREGGPSKRDSVPPRFRVGERVRARNLNPCTHTRLPRYVRAKSGVIECVHGTFVRPDTSALGKGENPEPVYSVCFAGRELWGEQAEPNQSLYIDLWESYLEPV